MTVMSSSTRVLVTGASGYLGIHCVKQLLEKGYIVRGTVRNRNSKNKIDPLKALRGAEERLELVEADLEKPNTWAAAVTGCQYILHVASPFTIVSDESIIKTAIEGTLNVLKAASNCNDVKKIVLTSSVAAINEGHDDVDTKYKVYNEDDWSNTNSKKILNYSKSKTLAERAAWDFVKNIKPGGNRFALTCINPSFIVGPLLVDEQGASVTIISRFLSGEMPAIPQLQLGIVDVRDVATAHVNAMIEPRSDGHRVIVSAHSLWFRDIARILKREFASQGYKVPSMQAPNAVVCMFSLFDVEARQTVNYLGKEVRLENGKAKYLLGIEFKDPAKSIVEMAYSMIERGILPKHRAYRGQPRADSATRL